jgi:hypothetical protein
MFLPDLTTSTGSARSVPSETNGTIASTNASSEP